MADERLHPGPHRIGRQLPAGGVDDVLAFVIVDLVHAALDLAGRGKHKTSPMSRTVRPTRPLETLLAPSYPGVNDSF